MIVNLPHLPQSATPILPINTETAAQTAVSPVPATVILCSTFLRLDNDDAVHSWASQTLQALEPTLKLEENAAVEVIVGREANSPEMQYKMQALLYLLMQRSGLLQSRLDIFFMEGDLNQLQARVWCVTAVNAKD